jgi:hypothetical protein
MKLTLRHLSLALAPLCLTGCAMMEVQPVQTWYWSSQKFNARLWTMTTPETPYSTPIIQTFARNDENFPMCVRNSAQPYSKDIVAAHATVMIAENTDVSGEWLMTGDLSMCEGKWPR